MEKHIIVIMQLSGNGGVEMKVSDMILLMNDRDKVVIHYPGGRIKTGNWYEDHVLDEQDREIAVMTYTEHFGFDIYLKREEEDE